MIVPPVSGSDSADKRLVGVDETAGTAARPSLRIVPQACGPIGDDEHLLADGMSSAWSGRCDECAGLPGLVVERSR
jgi:hypothetical protein